MVLDNLVVFMSGSIPHTIEAKPHLVDRNLANSRYAAAPTLSQPTDDTVTNVRSNSDYFVTLSEEAQNLLDEQNTEDTTTTTDADENTSTSDDDTLSEPSLDEDQRKEVDELKARDQEVRTHEQAHASTGGQYAGSPSYTYEQGPDGKRYVTDGEVQIDVSEVAGDPQATIDKMRQVYRAALAPAEPSGADRSVAAEARQKMASAMSELAQSSTSTVSNASPSESADPEKNSTDTPVAPADISPTSDETPPKRTGPETVSRSTLEMNYGVRTTPTLTGGAIHITA